jgi:hypothetical protein
MARRKIVRKKKIYDVDWYLSGTDYCYRTTLNVTWEQVKEIKRTAKFLGERVEVKYSHTKEEVYIL